MNHPMMPKYHLQPTVDPSEDYEAILARREELLAADIGNRLKAANVPSRLLDASLENYRTLSSEQATVLQKVRDFINAYEPKKAMPARCMLMFGQTGTGKTHLAVAVMRAVCSHYRTHYTTVSALARAVRSTYHKASSETEADVLAAHISPALLVIDEVGIGLGTDHERAMLHDVVAGRYDAMRPTIMVSNLDLDSIKGALGERIIDRIREDNGVVLKMNWPSHRASV